MYIVCASSWCISGWCVDCSQNKSTGQQQIIVVRSYCFYVVLVVCFCIDCLLCIFLLPMLTNTSSIIMQTPPPPPPTYHTIHYHTTHTHRHNVQAHHDEQLQAPWSTPVTTMARGKRYLWMGHEDGMVVVWHAHSKQPLTAPFAAFKSAIRCVWSCAWGVCVQ